VDVRKIGAFLGTQSNAPTEFREDEPGQPARLFVCTSTEWHTADSTAFFKVVILSK
jgi:hypothetical protein